MRELSEIYKIAQKILACPICHRKYDLSDIKLVGMWQGIYILQVNCIRNHPSVNMTVVISEESINNKSKLSLSKNTQNKSDLININKFEQALMSFDGDFEKLWKK